MIYVLKIMAFPVDLEVNKQWHLKCVQYGRVPRAKGQRSGETNKLVWPRGKHHKGQTGVTTRQASQRPNWSDQWPLGKHHKGQTGLTTRQASQRPNWSDSHLTCKRTLMRRGVLFDEGQEFLLCILKRNLTVPNCLCQAWLHVTIQQLVNRTTQKR